MWKRVVGMAEREARGEGHWNWGLFVGEMGWLGLGGLLLVVELGGSELCWGWARDLGEVFVM